MANQVCLITPSTFGNQGIVITDIEGDMEGSLSIAIQNDNKIVVGGYNNRPFEYHDFVLARYIGDNQTGIKNIKPLSFSISPNPCADFLTVDVSDQSTSVNCIISDLTGRVIWQETVYPGYDGKLNLDTRILNNGFYMLGISNNSKRGVSSFVVHK